jgi:hypothetical protein
MQNHQGGFLWIDDCPMDRTLVYGGNEDSAVVGSGHLSMLSPCCACSKLTIIFGCMIVIISIVIMIG